jgi:hypothetical protein
MAGHAGAPYPMDDPGYQKVIIKLTCRDSQYVDTVAFFDYTGLAHDIDEPSRLREGDFRS